ncbi:hypothetical protein SELSPUOL_00664 [Selenomonas sputigena ATCC 35185]|uniref:Uncharacterized protein n=1 Tax=Selenomonas sputigena (strain ATCC 35185 / DSM 20758 / CCUG 44933 / VPI D19B-28) TaxID=546271 RepID=C9LT84_SELS3|nr:hypothetical protein SELSPUOL_00664 [Selenomonas sputigena ATCC 35185]
MQKACSRFDSAARFLSAKLGYKHIVSRLLEMMQKMRQKT